MFLHNVKVDIILKGKVKNYQQSLREVVSYQTFYVFSISITLLDNACWLGFCHLCKYKKKPAQHCHQKAP